MANKAMGSKKMAAPKKQVVRPTSSPAGQIGRAHV